MYLTEAWEKIPAYYESPPPWNFNKFNILRLSDALDAWLLSSSFIDKFGTETQAKPNDKRSYYQQSYPHHDGFICSF